MKKVEVKNNQEQKPGLEINNNEFVEASSNFHNKNVDSWSIAKNNNSENTRLAGGAHDFSRISIFSSDSERIQPKLQINSPGDHFEVEADRVAQQVLSMDEPGIQRKCSQCGKEHEEQIQRKSSTAQSVNQIQRKCAQCQKEEKEGFIQTKSKGQSGLIADSTLTKQIHQTRGQGNKLDNDTRSYMEPRFGMNFSQVRIHTDDQAAKMSQQINARAFTVGQDIYFNRGQYQTNSAQGKMLLAHELTHTLQQSNNTIRKQGENTGRQNTNISQRTNLLVEDESTPASGQMKKSAFLQLLNREVCDAVDQELQGTPYSSNNCPYIRSAFNRHRNSSATYLEQLLLRYQPGASSVSSTRDLISLILTRVRRAVNSWKKRGNLSDVPENISDLVAGLMSGGGSEGSTQNNASDSGGGILFKANQGGSQSKDTSSVMQNLGKGHALRGDVRSKMENAFGTSFADVEIHSDSQASKLSGDMNARAFAVGNHIAFNSGEYKPGTLVGDALIAHELAHVSQQQNELSSASQIKQDSENKSLETDADLSAMNAIVKTWGGLKEGIKNIRKNAMPRLRSGLRLQRCPAIGAGAASLAAGTGGGTVVLGGTAVTTTGLGLATAKATVLVGSAAVTAVALTETYDAVTAESATTTTVTTAEVLTAAEITMMAAIGNVIHDHIVEEAKQLAVELEFATTLAGVTREVLCEMLKKLAQKYRKSDKEKWKKIIATQKGLGCRRSRANR